MRAQHDLALTVASRSCQLSLNRDQIVRVQGAENPSRLPAMSGELQRSNRAIWTDSTESGEDEEEVEGGRYFAVEQGPAGALSCS
jgi:hypothetical protein